SSRLPSHLLEHHRQVREHACHCLDEGQGGAVQARAVPAQQGDLDAEQHGTAQCQGVAGSHGYAMLLVTS
ncbi:hypothetical protein, partial [Klebsiella aerogenes]|uniref:hypothetical protein n=1 Tax=Klebsiella aerogenes TaxID=548 RepID=UPI0019539A0C